jgi:hypothetical protein
MMGSMSRVGCLVCALVFLLWGCAAPPWDRSEPDDAFRVFLQAAEAQDYNLVWEFLSENSKRELQGRADAFNAALPYASPRSPASMMRFGRMLSTTHEYKKIVIKSRQSDEAVVSIFLHDDAQIDVSLLRESGRWTVNLPLTSASMGNSDE